MEINDKYLLHRPPQRRSNENIKNIMIKVIIALLPSIFSAIYFFGKEAFSIILISCLSCLFTELLCDLLKKDGESLHDLSCMVTALIFALSLSSKTPLFVVCIGSIVSISIGKMCFGGIGKNPFNPAMVGRVFIALSFGSLVNTFIDPTDLVTGATPLTNMLNGTNDINLLNLLLGYKGGAIGETNIIAILIGGLYLIFSGVIDYKIPLTILLSSTICSFIFTGNFYFTLQNILSGGLIFSMFFIATDYTTSPTSSWGRIIYGLILGALIISLRYLTKTESVSYSILIMNMFVPLFDKIRPKTFGKGVKDNEQ
jgi:Na+-translocating ferredoxin:NAD+ oxidoreductase subunit D